MKKIILAFVTIITMMLCIASPLFIKPIKANAALPNFENEPQPIFEDLWSEPINNENYVYSYNKLLSFFSNTYSHDIPNSANYFSMTYKQKTPSSYDYQNMCFWYDSADVSIDGNHIVIQNMVNGSICSQCTYDNVQVIQDGVGKVDFDFDTFTFQFWDRDGDTYALRYLYQASWPVTDIWNVYTNIDGIASSGSGLNLEVNFYPDLSGNVNRESVIDGKKYISESLELTVTNNGSDAQWAMFIVPHGSSVYVPTESSAMETFQYSGKCTFAYVTNEWQTYDSAGEAVGAIWGQDVSVPSDYFQSPSVWHAIPHGEFRNYSISWSSMSLEKGVFYDVVVYASLNDQLEDSGTSSMMNGNTRPAYTVTLNVSAQEIYRSSFHILNPAEFNPDSVDSNGTISWNPLTDNDDIFKGSTAYKDSHGNLVIDNSSYSPIIGNGINGAYNSNSKGFASLNGMFSSFFGFLNSALSAFPSVYLTIITAGFTGLVIIGIVKVAIK